MTDEPIQPPMDVMSIPVDPLADTEHQVRWANDQIIDQLQVKRAQRDLIQLEIKRLVSAQEVMAQVIGAFDRAKKKGG